MDGEARQPIEVGQLMRQVYSLPASSVRRFDDVEQFISVNNVHLKTPHFYDATFFKL